MTTLTFEIPDHVDARAVRIELACRLFDQQKMSKSEACRMCDLTRDEFDAELLGRGLPVLRYTESMWEQDQAHAHNFMKKKGTSGDAH